jgi:hypothetical protein
MSVSPTGDKQRACHLRLPYGIANYVTISVRQFDVVLTFHR